MEVNEDTVVGRQSATFVAMRERGEVFFDQLQTRIPNPTVTDATTAPLRSFYNVQCSEEELGDESLATQGIGVEDYEWLEVSSLSEKTSAYSNFFCPKDGVILCTLNNKSLDKNPNSMKLTWNKIIFRCWEDVCRRQNRPVRGLKTVWRYHVANSTTQKILEDIEAEWGPIATGQYKECFAGEEAFFALLGTPNGSGVARMLTGFCGSLDRKTITSVRLFQKEKFANMYWVISDSEYSLGTAVNPPTATNHPIIGVKHRRIDSAGNYVPA